MALKICLKLDEKFVKFENDFTQLGVEMAEMQLEYANLRAEIVRKNDQFVNEVAKLKEENRILKARLMNANNVTGEDEQVLIFVELNGVYGNWAIDNLTMRKFYYDIIIASNYAL
jgi:hypothetical protein